MATATSGDPVPSSAKSDEKFVLDHFDHYLEEGLALKRWFEAAHGTKAIAFFDLVQTRNRPDRSRGFFAQADLGGSSRPVMGVVDEVFYDRPKAPPGSERQAALWMRDQIREFVLKYFLRITDCRRPEEVSENRESTLSEILEPLGLRSGKEIEREGMGFCQRYRRRRDSSRIEEVAAEEGTAVMDLRELGKTYDRIIFKLQIYQFNVSVRPMGNTSPYLLVPLKEESYLIASPEFIVNRDDPEPGVLGEYELGYAFMKNPHRGPFAYGPGEFEVAFQTINFRVLETGETLVRMTFTSDQPQKIVNLMLDPVAWSFTMADLVSFGQASRVLGPFRALLEQMPFRDFNLDPTVPALDWMNTLTAGQLAQQLSISKEELYRGFLRRHSLQHYQTVLGSLRTWRQIPDWLNEADLPPWVTQGCSS